MEEALKNCRKHLGDNATILYDHGLTDSMKKLVKEQGKKAGGPWECYYATNFYGWEADRVVAVTNGISTMEMITRAKTLLAVITVNFGYPNGYAKTKEYIQQAADQGLIEDLSLDLEINLTDFNTQLRSCPS